MNAESRLEGGSQKSRRRTVTPREYTEAQTLCDYPYESHRSYMKKLAEAIQRIELRERRSA